MNDIKTIGIWVDNAQHLNLVFDTFKNQTHFDNMRVMQSPHRNWFEITFDNGNVIKVVLVNKYSRGWTVDESYVYTNPTEISDDIMSQIIKPSTRKHVHITYDVVYLVKEIMKIIK